MVSKICHWCVRVVAELDLLAVDYRGVLCLNGRGKGLDDAGSTWVIFSWFRAFLYTA
jgi:hypothetical protein